MHSSEIDQDSEQISYHLWIGQLMLWIGFLIAAFSAVSKVQQPNKWQTIPWGIYLPSLAMGFAGIVIIKRWSPSSAADDDVAHSQYETAAKNLLRILELIDDATKQTNRPPKETLRWIDEQCTEPLAEFANARQSIANRFNMKVYADVMTEFASAERSINRTWSAAADGYIDEVNQCLEVASQHLRQAHQIMQRAEESELTQEGKTTIR